MQCLFSGNFGISSEKRTGVLPAHKEGWTPCRKYMAEKEKRYREKVKENTTWIHA
ncbi:MAG: hypothetical protein PWP08_1394 [Methanofollis sp.]|nr:hypothetical protein [Methanofollis sp.]